MDEEQRRFMKYVLRPILWEWMDDYEYEEAGVSAESFVYNTVLNNLRELIAEVIQDEVVWDEFLTWTNERYTNNEALEIGDERLRVLYNNDQLKAR